MHVRAVVAAFLLSMASITGLRAGEAAELRWVTLRVADPAAGGRWYERHFGGEARHENDRWTTRLGSVELRFRDDRPIGDKYERGAVDHLAFEDPDVAGRIETLAAAGVTIVQAARYTELGDFHYGFVEDPWGGKIEILSDDDARGLHHLHLYSKQPDTVLEWWRNELGGREAGTFRGFEHLRVLRFGPLRLIVQQDKGQRVRVASTDSPIYDLGWAVTGPTGSLEAPDGVLVTFIEKRR